MHVNVSGRRMLPTGNVLRSTTGRLTAVDGGADLALRDVFASADAGDAAVGDKGVAVSMQVPGTERHVAHVFPLTAGSRRRTVSVFGAVAAVFVERAALEAPSAAEALARVYKLTAIELRVLLGIVQRVGATIVAQDLGIFQTTVRSHLKHVFETTDTNRQAGLVELVGTLESPLLHH